MPQSTVGFATTFVLNKKTYKMNNELAQRIKALRNRKGYSQEELAEKTGLSLRTIQRIENGETEPRGDSLKRLAAAFDVSPDEITDWTIQEDKGFLAGLNLSALSFIVFPLLGILVPLIIWITKKDKIKKANEVAKELLNFQISWTMALFIGYIGLIILSFYKISKVGDVSPSLVTSNIIAYLIFFGVMYLLNLILIIVNTVRINNNKNVIYHPKIRFIRR
jgi:transcriptional regulator with XRE-family HTH domain